MKKYQTPMTFVGIEAILELTISLYTWIHWLHPLTLEEDKPQIEFLAKIIKKYIFLEWWKY